MDCWSTNCSMRRKGFQMVKKFILFFLLSFPAFATTYTHTYTFDQSFSPGTNHEYKYWLGVADFWADVRSDTLNYSIGIYKQDMSGWPDHDSTVFPKTTSGNFTNTFNYNGNTYIVYANYTNSEETKKVNFVYTIKNNSGSVITAATVQGSTFDISIASGASSSGTTYFEYQIENEPEAPFQLLLYINGQIYGQTTVDLSTYSNNQSVPISVIYGLIGNEGGLENPLPPGSPETPDLPPDSPPDVPENPVITELDFEPPDIIIPDSPEYPVVPDLGTSTDTMIEAINHSGVEVSLPSWTDVTVEFYDATQDIKTGLTNIFNSVSDALGYPFLMVKSLQNIYIPDISAKTYSFTFMTYKGKSYNLNWAWAASLLETIRLVFAWFLYFVILFQVFLVAKYLIGGK